MKVLQITRDDLITGYVKSLEFLAWLKILEDSLDSFTLDSYDCQSQELRFFH